MPVRDVSGWLPGVILIVVGVMLFAVQALDLDADVIVLVIGVVFATAFVATRRYGLLIPAGIMTGLGTGILLEDLGMNLQSLLPGIWIHLDGSVGHLRAVPATTTVPAPAAYAHEIIEKPIELPVIDVDRRRLRAREHALRLG